MLTQCTDSSTDFTHFTLNSRNLIFAVWRSSVPAVQAYVLNLGIGLARINAMFGSVLHFIWEIHRWSILRRLLRRLGPEFSKSLLNFKPNNSNTPLYNAAATDEVKVIQLMLQHGADMDLEGGLEGSPMMVAAAYGRFRTVRLLVSAGALSSYFDSKTVTAISALEKAMCFPKIQRWLLVDRWEETKSIGWIQSSGE